MNNYNSKNRRYNNQRSPYYESSAQDSFDSRNDGFDDDFDDDFDEIEPAAPLPQKPAEPEIRRSNPYSNNKTASDTQRTRQHTSHSGFEEDDDSTQSYFLPRRQRSPYVPDMHNHEDSAEFDPIDVNPEKNEKKASLAPFIACLAIMCLLGAFFLSSGDIIYSDSKITEHLSAHLDLSVGFDTFLTNVQNTAQGLPKVYTLPMNESPAQPANEDNYSSYVDENGIEHFTYIDPTITVDSWRQRYQVNEYSIMAAVSKIKIAHPTQLRTALAGGQYGSTRLKPSTISKQVNAIVAINGDLYNYNGKNTLMIRQGTVYRDYPYSYSDVLYIDSNGDFTIMRGNEAFDNGFYPSDERTIYQTITFGPPLVMDGELIQFDHGIPVQFYYRNPRSAIGQLGPLEYILVAVEGRSDDSKGLATNDLAYLMYDLGCVQAYNLDGGQSSMLIFHNKPFNRISNGGERTFSDIIYFGSAYPPEQA